MKYIHMYTKGLGFKVTDDKTYEDIEIIPRNEQEQRELVVDLVERLLKNRDVD